jgi:hypothetical protein
MECEACSVITPGCQNCEDITGTCIDSEVEFNLVEQEVPSSRDEEGIFYYAKSTLDFIDATGVD